MFRVESLYSIKIKLDWLHLYLSYMLGSAHKLELQRLALVLLLNLTTGSSSQSQMLFRHVSKTLYMQNMASDDSIELFLVTTQT